MSINLHIDRLVLDGFDFSANGQAQLRHALQQQLRSLLSTDGVRTETGSQARRAVNAGTIDLVRHPQPAATGRQLGRAIYRGLNHAG